MKNFPHQINDLAKFQGALAIIADMIRQGIDVSSDTELGEALVVGGIYSFRDKTLSPAQALALERAKPKQNRGSETAARDIRRFFELSGFIQEDGSVTSFGITPRGAALLNAVDSIAALADWRAAMRDLELRDPTGNISHPYWIMLRLVAQFPGIETSKLMLALEPVDDSQAEYDRIASLVYMSSDDIRQAVGASESHARNAVKILPAIARQLGDIVSSGGRSFPAPIAVTSEDGTVIVAPEGTIPDPGVRDQTPVSPDEIAPTPDFRDAGEAFFDLRAGIAIRQQRTREHQDAVRSLAYLLDASGFLLFENPFDCLAVTEARASILFEVKTLTGDLTDERQQASRALGQLKSYRFFHMPADLAHSPAIDVAAFTLKPSQETINFLWSSRILVVWLFNGQWWIQNPSSNAVEPFAPENALGRF